MRSIFTHIRVRSIIALLLSFTLIVPLFPYEANAATVNQILRVGLYYGSNALPTANLANEKGSGFRFGFYDSNRSFIPVGYTSIEKITVCKDTNIYYAGGSYYDTQLSTASSLVGAYHLEVDQSFSTYEEACAAASLYPYGFPAYINGTYRVRFEFYSTSENAYADSANYSGVSVVGASASCYTVVASGSNTILFEYDSGAGGNFFGIMPDITGASTVQTWFKGYRYTGGFEYCRRTGENLTVINYVNIDEYIQGVIPYEMNPSWPLETLKAGAVAARTFAEKSIKHRSAGFDVCATTDCQVYRGVYSGTHSANVSAAALQTSGQCIYYDGKLIEALYHAADGGATEDVANTWGTKYSYLTGKEDPYELSISVPASRWSYSLSGDELADVLRQWSSSYANCSTIVSFKVTQYTKLDNVNAIEMIDSNGRKYTFTMDQTRGIFQNYFPNGYFSRRYIVVAPGETYIGEGVDTTESTGEFVLTNGEMVRQAESVYALTATGIVQVSGAAAVITSSGIEVPTVETPEDSGHGFGTVTNTSSSEWLIVGSGYGHNVGMSQYGAYAMGLQGYTYDQILSFYYTGVTIS